MNELCKIRCILGIIICPIDKNYVCAVIQRCSVSCVCPFKIVDEFVFTPYIIFGYENNV